MLLATVIGGWRAGMVAQVLGGFAAWLFFDPSFMPPAQAFGDQIGDFALYGLSSGLIIWACEHYRRLIRRLDEEEHYRRLVVDELNHRLRNKLAVVHAILRHELRDQEDIRTSILERLKALAAADELLARPDWEVVDIREIFGGRIVAHTARRAMRQREGGRCSAAGPSYAATLTLIFHELATNAAKHGALKLPGGKVSISWSLDADTLRIAWNESGGPPVSAPQRRGFGTGLFRRALDPFHGTISTAFEPAGIRCEIRLDIPERGKAGAGSAVPVMPKRLWGERTV